MEKVGLPKLNFFTHKSIFMKIALPFNYAANCFETINKHTFRCKLFQSTSMEIIKEELLCTIFFLHFNFACSLVLVLLNKWVYTHINFPNLTLTLLHFVTTFIGLNICEKFNVFQIKLVPIKDVYLLSATFCGFVIFTNLSLQYNTVGTYQLSKMLTTPMIIFLQMLIYHKTFSFKIKCTLIPIITGVFMNFYYDIKFNSLGACFAVIGVFVTSLYQILVSSKQHELQMNPMQLLYYQAPISSLMLLVFVFCLEPPLKTFSHPWRIDHIGMIFLSCVTAFFLNISIYWIIGKTSPLTYNMVGHLKFCFSVLGGCFIFNDSVSNMQIVGVTMTLSGVTYYAHLKLKESYENQKSLEEG